MSDDISHILSQWPFHPDEPIVRIIEGDDGRKRVQMRVDMGLLQMEMDGRPDGQRPNDCESLLEACERDQEAYDAEHLDSAPFQLNEESCAELWREGVQYYHRYLAFWVLKLYDLCARDTARNLRLFAFVRQYAPEDHVKFHFDQWRPYVIMMNTRALASSQLDADQRGAALATIDAGIAGIHEFLDEYDLSDKEDECQELENLVDWRAEVVAESSQADDLEPKTQIEVLRQQLSDAITEERFEEAAGLRDEIRRLSEEEESP